METKRLLFIYTLILLIALIITGINPASRTIWFLENLLVFITVILIFTTRKKFEFSKTSYTLIFLFLLIGTIGAHYTYEQVPIENLKNFLGTERNPHDRIVHFLFGLILYYPILEFFKKTSKSEKKEWIYFVPLIIIIGFGAIYEMLEWIVAMHIDPKNASAFLGMQGDDWDAQKDMLMNFLGALVTLIISKGLEKKHIQKSN